MLTIKTWRDPYDSGFSPTKPTSIQLESGISVLVGCNGAGKTTLLDNIKEEMKKQEIPCIYYSNLKDGGSNALERSMYNNIELGMCLWASSEGEAIKLNFGTALTKFKKFIRDGIVKRNPWKEDREIETNIRVFLFDAIDSGLSIDSIIEIKDIFNLILEDAEKLNKEVYIIISANEYELARHSNCFDVNKGKYIKFKDYEAYRAFIIKSREAKEKRIEKQKVWYDNKRKREEAALERRKAKYEPLISKIKEQAEREGRSLTWREKSKIDDYERIIKQNK